MSITIKFMFRDNVNMRYRVDLKFVKFYEILSSVSLKSIIIFGCPILDLSVISLIIKLKV